MDEKLCLDWHEFEKRGWSWCIGWSITRGRYAQAWRDLKKPIWVDGMKVFRECKIETGRSELEAVTKLQQRLRQLDK